MRFGHLASFDLNGFQAWAKRLVDDLNRFDPSIERLAVFDDDVAAANGRVKVGQPYRDPNGFVRWRVS